MTLKPIPEWPNHFGGSDGHIYSRHPRWKGQTRRLAEEIRKRNPYVTVALWDGERQIKKRVHRLILFAFYGMPAMKGLLSRHLNGDARDNRPRNLRWGTNRENVMDQIRHGNRGVGEMHHQSRYSNEIVASIRKQFKAGVPQIEIASQTGMSKANVCCICNEKVRRWG